MNQPDAYGIPEGMFGQIDPELPALIGRVVMVAALHESKVAGLAANLGWEVPTVYDRATAQANIDHCIDRLGQYDSSDLAVAWATNAVGVVKDAERALRRRHSIVHRVWPHATGEQYGGWKQKPEPDAKGRKSQWKDFTREELIGDLNVLLSLIPRIRDVLPHAGSFPRPPASRNTHIHRGTEHG